MLAVSRAQLTEGEEQMKTMSTVAALAALAAMALVAPQAANAAGHRKMHMMKKVKLVPASAKPGYKSMVGTPSLIDPVPVAPNGGALGLGLIPSTNLFKGVPVLEQFGL